MTIDISRKSFNHRKNYSSLISEQGRVQLDSDWNEGAQIARRQRLTKTLDSFGRCRVSRQTPDAFRITIENGGLAIGPGRLYVDGLLAENHGGPPEVFNSALSELTGTAAIPFEQQPFVFASRTNNLADGRYLVYLDVWERCVTYLEDPDLVEKAVGIPTTSRTQTVWQVNVYDQTLGADIVCSTSDENIPGWQDLIRPSGGQLSSRAIEASNSVDPCLLPPSGGYRGLENRTYRVEIHDVDDNGNATFKWARYNGTVATIVIAMPSLDQLKVASIGRDSILRFNPGDWVEVYDDAIEFSDHPGVFRRIESVDDTDNTLILSESLPPELFPTVDGNGTLDKAGHTRVHKWDQSDVVRDTGNNVIVDLDAPESEGVIPVPAPGISIHLEEGVQITFDLAEPGGRFRAGDHWVFTARTIDASVQELDHAPPCGIHHHYCRLALVEVVNNVFTAIVEDCRILSPEEPGTVRGCCSVTIAPEESIQSAINSLPAQGGRLCLLPGVYRQNIRINGRRNITLIGCGRRTRVISASPDEGSEDADPVIDITNSTGIRIESLAVEAHARGVGILVQETSGAPNTRQPLQVAEIELLNLHINAARRSGIEIQAGKNIEIRGCHIDMEANTRSDWPGIFLIAQDALIQDNEIRVVPPARSVGVVRNGIQTGRGGLQIGGTSEQIRIINNLIREGIGNGITLGSLEEVNDRGSLVLPFIPWRPFGNDEPCDECAPITPRIPPFIRANETGGGGNEEDARNFRSAGPLYDITIEGNKIDGMGLYGIGVAGFFDLNEVDEFITVDGLTICNNEIQHCLNRPLAPIDEVMINSMAHGGIALADVENLVICHNKIENNGASFIEPICGIFILHAQGAEISDNRIVNNGPKVNSRETPEQGRRGGINIVLATAPTLPTRIGFEQNSTLLGATQTFPRQNGVPAAKIHNNIVSQPMGRALDLTALGPVSVVNNQFTSRGVLSIARQFTQSSIGSTAIIMNLGISNELYGQLLNFSGIISGDIGSYTTPTIEQGALIRSQEGLDDLRVGQYLANGNVLFSHNQCVLDLLQTGLSRANSSVALYSLDDIGFHNNQCDCSLFEDFISVNLFAFAPSVRVSDSRFKEGIHNAAFSATTIGNMNATTNNQATHCLLVSSIFPDSKVDSGNRILLNEFDQGHCQRNRDALNATNFRLRRAI